MARISNHQRFSYSLLFEMTTDLLRLFTTRNYHLQCARCQNLLSPGATNR